LTLKTIVKGKVTGKVLKSSQPINFLGSVDKKTGAITDQKHDLFGKKIAGSILVFPNGIGSSVGAYTIYSLKSNNSAPAAMAGLPKSGPYSCLWMCTCKHSFVYFVA